MMHAYLRNNNLKRFIPRNLEGEAEAEIVNRIVTFSPTSTDEHFVLPSSTDVKEDQQQPWKEKEGRWRKRKSHEKEKRKWIPEIRYRFEPDTPVPDYSVGKS
jgi:hypothetical protein